MLEKTVINDGEFMQIQTITGNMLKLRIIYDKMISIGQIQVAFKSCLILETKIWLKST